MKAVPGILPTLLEMIYFFSTPPIDVEPIFTRLLPDRTKEQPLSREESGCSQLSCKNFA